MIALAAADSAHIGTHQFTVVGGRVLSDEYLSELSRLSPDVSVRLLTPGSTDGQNSAGVVTELIDFPFVDASGPNPVRGTAMFAIQRSTGELAAISAGVRRWTLGVMFAAAAVAAAAALLLAWRVSRPLEELAQEAAGVELGSGGAAFAGATREDEVGDLARRMQAMVLRLRSGADRLRDAERRATLGEMARQVNHDIKNGLTPIRNVVRHLSQVADADPGNLPSLFQERRESLESGIQYLDSLARSYAALSPASQPGVSDVDAVVSEVLRDAALRAPGAAIGASVARGLPPVGADATTLRRILENVVGNAVDAAGSNKGNVRVSAALRNAPAGAQAVRIEIADNGAGMTSEELKRAFDDFYTTKPGGTGLGLSVVRRLMADIGGELAVDSRKGSGTTVTLDIPLANEQRAPAAKAT
jgi:two-component system sensor histidine kinase AtoS